ncbi:MAG TPA: hypothetical protein VLB44_05650 [Kofleriaceae bacterium]|nr:hypothetical protein [Kofleriaceae bacterium]
MGTINADWHRAHVMPKNATDKQRAKWHYEHAQQCGCRAITPSIAALLKEHGYKPPKSVRPAKRR